LPLPTFIDSANPPQALIARIESQRRLQFTHGAHGRIAWHVWGEGPIMLLLHGGHGSWRHWVRNIEALAERHTVVVPDMPGFGDSDDPPEPFTGDSLAQLLREGIDEVIGAQTRLQLVGFSMGTMIGGQLAARLPGRIERMVLTSPGGLLASRPTTARLMSWRALRDPQALREAHHHNLAVVMLHKPDAIDDLAIYIQHINSVQTRLNAWWMAKTDTLLRALPQIDAPLFGIWGECDALVGPHLEERFRILRGFQPHLRIATLPGVGHWLPFEDADNFNRLILE